MSSAVQGIEYMGPEWTGAPRPFRPATSLLLELIDADGVCLGLYWAGRSNRIEKGPRGIEVTYDLAKARRIPLTMRDVAEQLAETLNGYADRSVFPDLRSWRVVELAE